MRRRGAARPAVVRLAIAALAAAGAAAALPAARVNAHEVRPAYLELVEGPPGRYSVLWKRPARGDGVLRLTPELPGACREIAERRIDDPDGAQIEHWAVDCGASGLDRGAISIEGLSATMTDALVRIERADGSVRTALLRPDAPVLRLDAAGGTPVAGYLRLGVEHILFGVDHLLFVLGLLILVGRRWGVMAKTITAFTLAHSVTLALATLGVVRPPQAPIEAVIALSIMFVAAEILYARAGSPGLAARAPWVAAFAFGLLHGFGFAGALLEVGLPRSAVPPALLLFNVGVEAGQLLFVAGVEVAIALARRLAVTWPRWAEPLPAYAIGGTAAFWLIQRVAAF